MPRMNRMTDACENITLPHTSFVGAKYFGAIWLRDMPVDNQISIY